MNVRIVTEGHALANVPVADVNGSRDHSRRNALLCAVAVAACVLATYPVADMPFPFMDDFSYTKTALEFTRTGHFIYNGWAVEILGWLIPWGALFIKIFGFSFNVVRFSMLPLDMVTVYLFHQVLRRFGVNPRNAVLGTLTMALSPLFLPLAASYMTDIPGVLVILLCMYMCQRAVAAKSDRAALLWLAFAMLLNLAGGTVRQIAWLGSLIMAPSTAWLLREQRGMKMAAVALFLSSLLGVEACMHWFSQQPYSVPEHIFQGPIHLKMLAHLGAQLLKTFLCLLLVVLPISAAWLILVRRMGRIAQIGLSGLLVMWAGITIVLDLRSVLGGWLSPWLSPLMDVALQGVLETSTSVNSRFPITFWIGLAISLAIVAAAFSLIGTLIARTTLKDWQAAYESPVIRSAIWILGPFSLGYILLLFPRGTYSMIQDRYLLGLAPSAIAVMLLLYQKLISKKISAISVVMLAIVAAYSVCSTHDLFAKSRAVQKTVKMLQASGVPRLSIQTGLTTGIASDGWAQIQDGRHINDVRIKVPAGAYNPHTPDLKLSGDCSFGFTSYMPAIVPKLFVVNFPVSCFAPTSYPSIHYRTWLPPFHRAMYVERRLPDVP